MVQDDNTLTDYVHLGEGKEIKPIHVHKSLPSKFWHTFKGGRPLERGQD